MSPCSKKLSDMKEKRFKKYVFLFFHYFSLSMGNTMLTVVCLCLVSGSHNLSSRNSARRTLSSRHRQNRKEIPGKDSNKLVRLSIMFLVLNGNVMG